jgi:hypothetical protein
MMIALALAVTDKQCQQRWEVSQLDHNKGHNRVFSVQSATEVKLASLKSPTSPRKKKWQQDRAKGKVMPELFLTHLELFSWNSSQRGNCKQAQLQADSSPSTQFNLL